MEEPRTFEEAVDVVLAEMREILLYKRARYGTSNITAQGLRGLATRLSDKMARVKTLVENAWLREMMEDATLDAPQAWPVVQAVLDEKFPTDEGSESVEDTLKDAGNYSIIGVLLRRGWWTLPNQGRGKIRVHKGGE